MASPFPGMDPYLEGDLWTTFHFGFAAEIIRQIAPKLRPRYVALPVERMVLDTLDDISITTTSTYPDVSLIESSKQPRQIKEAAAMAAPLQLATVMPQRIPHVSVEVRDTKDRTLVTAIELLSPASKRGEGREEYLRKRGHILLTSAHLLEIDLLRKGRRVPMQQALPELSYFVLLSRAEKRPIAEVWPIALDQPLPDVPIALLPGDADAVLELQTAFTATYELLGYEHLIDYAAPPDVALDEEAQA